MIGNVAAVCMCFFGQESLSPPVQLKCKTDSIG